MWRLGLAGVAACGRIGFGNVGPNDGPSDVVRGDGREDAIDAGISVVLVSDDFERTVANGWGSADIGGPWEIFNPDTSAVDVSDGRGHVALSGASGYADFNVKGTAARDTDTSATVSFDTVPATASYTATVSARWVMDGTDYRLHVDVLSGGALDVLLEAGGSDGYTTLATATTSIVVTANTTLGLSLYATGASPTALCGKLWLATAAEPSACTVSVTDSTQDLQVPGTSYLVTYDSGAAAPTVSFGAFRFLRVGPM